MIDINPYTSGAGVKPQYLAGREEFIKKSRLALSYISYGQMYRSSIFYGLRGVGKTVLLNEIEDIAEEFDFDLSAQAGINLFRNSVKMKCNY